MTPEAFIEKWQDSGLGERQASQSHFNDLCALLGERKPTDANLKKHSLSNLYNALPAWLDNIHKQLDTAVAAYSWDDYTPGMPDEEILARLFKLNQEREDV